MKLFITVTTILLIFGGADGCLRVLGSFSASCVGGQGHIKTVDNGETTCEGDCGNYRDCTLNCIGGYSARIERGYTHLSYSNPHNSYTQAMTPNENYFCCMFTHYGNCAAMGFNSHLDGSFFGC